MSREAMQMALEALVQLDGIDTETECVTIDVDDVITALRQALETEKQEPVAWRSTSPDGKLSNKFACKPTESNWVEPLYAAPSKREWVGLTALEIYECWKTGDVVEAVEAKLKEKNHG